MHRLCSIVSVFVLLKFADPKSGTLRQEWNSLYRWKFMKIWLNFIPKDQLVTTANDHIEALISENSSFIVKKFATIHWLFVSIFFSFPEQRSNGHVNEILVLCEVHFSWNLLANRFWGDVLKKSLSFCFKTNLICFKKNESSHSDPESRLSNHPFFLRPFMGFIASVPTGPWIPGTETELLAETWMSGPGRWNLFLSGQIDYVAVQCLRRW